MPSPGRELGLRECLVELIQRDLLLQFPANSTTVIKKPSQLSVDEAVWLLKNDKSPWHRVCTWSPEMLSMLEEALRHRRDLQVSDIISNITSLSLPLHNALRFSVRDATALRSLTALSLICSGLTQLPGEGLPRTLRSLQLYGNTVDTGQLLDSCPQLVHLGLGHNQLHDEAVRVLCTQLSDSGVAVGLRVLDVSDNDVVDAATIRHLLACLNRLSALNTCGNPAFLAVDYYLNFLGDHTGLQYMDGAEFTSEVRQQMAVGSQSPEIVRRADKSKRFGSKSPVSPAPRLSPGGEAAADSSSEALIRLTGLVQLPAVSRDRFAGWDVCVVVSSAAEIPDRTRTEIPPYPAPTDQGGCPVEDDGAGLKLQQLQPLATSFQRCAADGANQLLRIDSQLPMEWRSNQLQLLRDDMLHPLQAKIVAVKKIPKQTKKGDNKKGDKSKAANAKNEKVGKANRKQRGVGGGVAAAQQCDMVLGAVLISLRPLLRPNAVMLVQAAVLEGHTETAATTDITWQEMRDKLQQRSKALAKKKDAAKNVKPKPNKPNSQNRKQTKKSLGVRSAADDNTTAMTDEDKLQCYFTVELVRRPRLQTESVHLTSPFV